MSKLQYKFNICILSLALICVLSSIMLVKQEINNLQVSVSELAEANCFILPSTSRSLGIFEVTAYCPCEKCCGKWSDGHTANNHKIQVGDRFCAAPSQFSFGVVLKIPGYGTVPVWDRGGSIKGKKLDVFFPTHQEALNWGRQKLEIWEIL